MVAYRFREAAAVPTTAIPTTPIPTNIDQPHTRVWFSIFQVEVLVKVGNTVSHTAPLNARISGTE